MRVFILSLLLSGFVALSFGQDYHPIAGSNYAGALGVHQNPAGMVNTPYPWDLTVIGIQTKYQTNAVKIIDYSLLSSPATSKFIISGGSFGRFGNEQSNLNLLNGRISIKRKSAIGFGANIRSVANIRTSEYNYADSIQTAESFFSMNEATGPFDLNLRTNNLLEIYLSYAQTILDNTDYRLNGGLTVKINRGLAGAQAYVKDLSHSTVLVNGEKEYLVSKGELGYGYSSNFDRWNDNNSQSANLKEFLKGTRTGFSIDAGLELIIKPGGLPGYTEDEETYYDYDWKIGASLLDIGKGQYLFGKESRQGAISPPGIRVNSLDGKFDSTITNLETFNDSLSTIVSLNGYNYPLNIYTPARAVLNVDRFISGAWYLNAELSLNLTKLLGKNRLYVQDMNLFRVTPRWETRRWGLYLPMMVNTRGQFWVGAGAKAGPLLIGIHNLGNVFSKAKMANGGGYIALTIRPGKRVTSVKKQKQADCPPY